MFFSILFNPRPPHFTVQLLFGSKDAQMTFVSEGQHPGSKFLWDNNSCPSQYQLSNAAKFTTTLEVSFVS